MKNRLHRTNRPSFNFIGKILSIIVVSMIFFSCEEHDKRFEYLVDDEPDVVEHVLGEWERVFTDEFDDENLAATVDGNHGVSWSG